MDRADALLELLRTLKERDYRFTTITPATHARVLARPQPTVLTLSDVFGWNRPFGADQVDAGLLDLLRRADALREHGDRLCSDVRVASLGRDLFLHSAFPTEAEDAVFFGPDTYRFAAFVAHLGWQVTRIKGANAALALRLFRSNQYAGLLLAAGFALDALSRNLFA